MSARRIRVHVFPKPAVLDPQGAAVGRAMTNLGYHPSGAVRVGKTIDFALDEPEGADLPARIDTLCRDLLANPVIEDFRWHFLADDE